LFMRPAGAEIRGPRQRCCIVGRQAVVFDSGPSIAMLDQVSSAHGASSSAAWSTRSDSVAQCSAARCAFTIDLARDLARDLAHEMAPEMAHEMAPEMAYEMRTARARAHGPLWLLAHAGMGAAAKKVDGVPAFSPPQPSRHWGGSKKNRFGATFGQSQASFTPTRPERSGGRAAFCCICSRGLFQCVVDAVNLSDVLADRATRDLRRGRLRL